MKSIYLACAHTKDAYLDELVEEISALERILDPLHELEVWEVLQNRAVNLQDIARTFGRTKREIAIFHYAGHANQEELKLEGGGRSKGLAELFGLTQGKSLRLVFLNGCATEGHVCNLHEVGIPAVIATNRPINDTLARDFAISFYETWASDGKTLEQAFNEAKALVKTKTEIPYFDSPIEDRSAGRLASTADASIPWGLRIDPNLDPDQKRKILHWQLYPSVKLEPLLLEKAATISSDILLDIAYQFKQSDAETRKLMEEQRCSAPLALIIRMPWIVGTHLRRLFAWNKLENSNENSIHRLCEITSAYTELTRFICYIALSALWESGRNPKSNLKLPLLRVFEHKPNGVPPDYIFHLKQYHKLLQDISEDALEFIPEIGRFLSSVNGRLRTAYLFMERLKNAATQVKESPQLLQDLIANNEISSGGNEVFQQAEIAFGEFVSATLFLSKYKLYSVRSISVDKVRYLNLVDPFVHKTVDLHAAFGKTETRPTKRKSAADNYSILLTLRKDSEIDAFENALNLSPFYIDKHALIGEKREDVPAIFVLGNKALHKKVYEYESLDQDVSYTYLSPSDHQLKLTNHGLVGAMADSVTPLEEEDKIRFEEIYQQLEQLQKDFSNAL